MSILKYGIIFGQTAFDIYSKISNGHIDHNISLNQIELYFKNFNKAYDYFNHYYKIKNLSNCKLELTCKNKSDKTKYFLHIPMNYQTIKFISLKLKINSSIVEIKIEDILHVQTKVLLEPLLTLRKCQSINEALMNWSLNSKFMVTQNHINNRKLLYLMNKYDIFNPINFKEVVAFFLTCTNIVNFIPKKFKLKVQQLNKSKKKFLIKIIEFMDIIVQINEYFTKLVKKYYVIEHVDQITNYNLEFSIELYGDKDEISHPTDRKSLYMTKKNNGYIHLKTFAILFNMRWFFNTRYNSKQPLGFDKEYGITEQGYGQTLHKYDDVLLWLITHPNTLEDVEFVVLDSIPSNYIF